MFAAVVANLGAMEKVKDNLKDDEKDDEIEDYRPVDSQHNNVAMQMFWCVRLLAKLTKKVKFESKARDWSITSILTGTMQHDSEKKQGMLSNIEVEISEKTTKLNLHLEYPYISLIHRLVKIMCVGNAEMSLWRCAQN